MLTRKIEEIEVGYRRRYTEGDFADTWWVLWIGRLVSECSQDLEDNKYRDVPFEGGVQGQHPQARTC